MYFIFHLLLFNFQGPSGKLFLSRSSPSLHTRLRYYTISRSVCQGVLQKFFQLFQAARCLSKFRLILSVNPRRFPFEEAQLLSTRRSLFPFALRDLYIISYLFEFVKRFFKSFLSFFEVLSEALTSVLDATYILYHILSRLSSGFRKILEILFSTLSRTLCRFARAHSYNSIPYLPRFVKGFFEFFRNIFFIRFFRIISPIFRRSSRFIHIIRPPPLNN